MKHVAENCHCFPFCKDEEMVAVSHDREDGVHCGFDDLRRARPGTVVHSHRRVDREKQLDQTRVVGALEP